MKRENQGSGWGEFLTGTQKWLRGLSIALDCTELGWQTGTSGIWGADTAGRLWVPPLAGKLGGNLVVMLLPGC